jgi:hypothetical protein
MLRAIRVFFLFIVVLPVSAFAQMRTCPVGFNDMPAMSTHYDQSSILKLPLVQVFGAGQRIFVTDFNICDGAGRPSTDGRWQRAGDRPAAASTVYPRFRARCEFVRRMPRTAEGGRRG